MSEVGGEAAERGWRRGGEIGCACERHGANAGTGEEERRNYAANDRGTGNGSKGLTMSLPGVPFLNDDA